MSSKEYKPIVEMVFRGVEGSPEPLRYSIQRDVGYLHGPIIVRMVKLLEANACSDLFTADNGGRLTPEEIAEAIMVYCNYLDNVRKYSEHETAQSAMKAAGWFELKPAQRLAITSTIGSLYSVMAFQAQREVDSGQSGVRLAAVMDDLLKTAEDSCKAMTTRSATGYFSGFVSRIVGLFKGVQRA